MLDIEREKAIHKIKEREKKMERTREKMKDGARERERICSKNLLDEFSI